MCLVKLITRQICCSEDISCRKWQSVCLPTAIHTVDVCLYFKVVRLTAVITYMMLTVLGELVREFIFMTSSSSAIYSQYLL